MKKLKITANSSKKKITINYHGNHKVIRTIVFSSRQIEILNEASLKVAPLRLLKR